MNWIPLESAEQVKEIKQKQGYSIIFKHSIRCATSLMAKRRLEMDKDHLPDELPLYFLDLIRFREVSNLVAEDFQVYHESPQLLVIKDGECILDQSHSHISLEEALSVLS